VQTFSDQGLEIRRIILLRQRTGKEPEVLLGLEGAELNLPQVGIARQQRIAEQLTAAFKQTYGIDAVSVSSLEAHPGQSGSDHSTYEIMEPHRPQEETRRTERWALVNSLVESEFHDRNDFQALRQAVAQSIACVESASRGPFALLGWFEELEQWVQKEIRPHGLHLSGRFRQLNACPTFSLIRFETEGPAVWFKAVGAPNERECALTVALAHSFSRFLPQVLATRPDCNGWLAWEAEGPLLHECSAFGSWEMAARDLAQLQIRSIDRCAHLLHLGAHDLGTSALAALVESFLQAMGELMERQPKIPPARLSREQLRTLSAQVRSAISLLEKTGVPKTLGHMDLNPGNIVCSSHGSQFLDWAEAFVGHPFLTFEYLLEHFRRTFERGSSSEKQLVTRYVTPWRELVSERAIRGALDVIPLVAVFACAVANDRWTNPEKLEDPRTAGYLRALTRRMEREACRIPERSAYARVDRTSASLAD
jgi:hypothetical protein